jgi:hypothetical protein
LARKQFNTHFKSSKILVRPPSWASTSSSSTLSTTAWTNAHFLGKEAVPGTLAR